MNHSSSPQLVARQDDKITDAELARRMIERDRQLHADLCYDRETEAHAFPATMNNPHDD